MESQSIPTQERGRSTGLVPAILALLFFALYLATLTPDWGTSTPYNTWDALEYALCASTGGIDHPPGHPLYLIAARLFCAVLFFLPLPYAMNLFSAFFGALAGAAVFILSRKALSLIFPRCAALPLLVLASAAACTFGISGLFWSHAVITEVFTFFMFLMAMSLYFAFLFLERGGKKWLALSSLCAGLMMGTSILNALTFAAPLLLFLLLCPVEKTTAKERLLSLLLVIPGLLAYLYYLWALASVPPFIHPTAVMKGIATGSPRWFAAYMSGSPWREGPMFSIGRLFSNIVPYFRNIVLSQLPPVTLALFLAALVLTIVLLFPRRGEGLSRFSTRAKVLSLLVLLFLSTTLPFLTLSAMEGQGANTSFALPSLLLYLVLAAAGALALYLRILEGPLLALSGRARLPLSAMLVLAIFVLPLWLLAKNFPLVNGRAMVSCYEPTRAIVGALPPRSIIYSSLILQQLVTYFNRYDAAVAAKHLLVKSPDISVMERITAGAVPSRQALQKNALLKEDLERSLSGGIPLFIGGDSIDEDKYPEVLLMGDVTLEPYLPDVFFRPMAVVPTDALPYRIKGFRKAVTVKALPPGVFRGIANDGTFGGELQFLGYRLPPQQVSAVYRKKLTFCFYWKALREIPRDVLASLILLDERYRKVMPEKTTSFFTLGGKSGTSKWRTGEITEDQVYYYPPQRLRGKHFLALGVHDSGGSVIRYIPGSQGEDGKGFDFMLLLPLVL
ncbi:MAG: DUF2723 domain-containing protein [Candidatus Eremiobacteraeota bacterium]|nr:DUF2723 domain-containing protein [Candidatus Eremiobacteraeota bacterium]